MPMPDFVGWNQEQQASDQRSLGNLNVLTNVQQRRQKMEQERMMVPLDMDVKRAQAEYMRAHAGQLQAAAQKLQMKQTLLPLVMGDPDAMERLGIALGDAQLISDSKDLRKRKQTEGELRSMQSQQMSDPNSIVRPGGSMTESEVPTNEFADYLKVRNAQGPMTTQPSSAVPTQGGVLRPYMQSENAPISQMATTNQQRIDTATPGGMTPAGMQGLASSVTNAAQVLGNRPTPRPETPVAVIGPNGQARYVPASEAYGQTPASAANRGDVVEPENADLHGESYIATLPPGMRNVVRGLITYQLPLNQLSVRSGERQAAFAHAAQADPNFNVAKYQQRQKVMNDFTSGKVADNLTALGQAINHMNTMAELSDALKNGNVQVINQAVNFARRQLGDPSISNYETAQSAVGTELMRVFRQVQASEVETKDWISKFPTKGSPEQIKGALATGAKLLKGRMDELNHRWNRGMDTDTGYPGLMSPAAQGSFEKLLGNIAAPTAPQYVEIRVSPSGKKLGKKTDGTIEEIK